jgi:AcrR family transcriptional regulator
MEAVVKKKSAETERKILGAALELFVRKGYHGTSIDDIMRKVGLTKGALYAHFTSKGELLERTIEEFKIRFIDKMIQMVNECDDDALGKLHRMVSFNSKFAFENQNLCVFLTFLTTELNEDANFKPLLKGIYRKYQTFISQLIRLGIKQGVLKKDLDPDLTALTFMALHDGVLHQWVLNRNDIDGGHYVKTFRNIFFNGLANHTSTILK